MLRTACFQRCTSRSGIPKGLIDGENVHKSLISALKLKANRRTHSGWEVCTMSHQGCTRILSWKVEANRTRKQLSTIKQSLFKKNCLPCTIIIFTLSLTLIGHSHGGQIFDGHGHVHDNRSQLWVVRFTRNCLTILLVGRHRNESVCTKSKEKTRHALKILRIFRHFSTTRTYNDDNRERERGPIVSVGGWPHRHVLVAIGHVSRLRSNYHSNQAANVDLPVVWIADYITSAHHSNGEMEIDNRPIKEGPE